MTGRRAGFSLLEVLLATSILIGSSIVLLELAMIGNRHASNARELARSQLICQTKLNEILAHIMPLETVRPTPVEDAPQWSYWVDVQPLDQSDLVVLEVTAVHEPSPGKQTARFSVVRWLRDPRGQVDPSSQPMQQDSTSPLMFSGGSMR